MTAATDEAHGIIDHHGPTAREDVVERQALRATDEDVRKIPERHESFAAGEPFVEDGWVERVGLGLAVEPAQPVHALGRVARGVETALDDESPDGTHRSAGHRIADEHLATP